MVVMYFYLERESYRVLELPNSLYNGHLSIADSLFNMDRFHWNNVNDYFRINSRLLDLNPSRPMDFRKLY